MEKPHVFGDPPTANIYKTKVPHIIYQNDDKTITLIDIPRSIEDAQYLSERCISRPDSKRRLISCQPVDTPYQSPEPKSIKALRNAPQKTIEELMLERYVQLALDEMKRAMQGQGTMCLDRILGKNGNFDGFLCFAYPEM